VGGAVVHHAATMTSPTPSFEDAQYISLVTFRQDGTQVPTPVWWAPLDGNLVVFTLRETYKVKRLRNDPRVRVAKCDVRGKVLGQWREGRAVAVDDPDREARAYDSLKRKYGLMMRLGNVLSTLTGRMKRRVVIEITLDS
jgi:PPOX class probable F420-dependent enzyme